MKNPITTLALIVGGLGGGLFLWNNQRQVRAQAFRATRAAAERVGYELPAGVRDAMLAPSGPPMPQFGVRNPYALPDTRMVAGGTPGFYDWMGDTSQYHDTLAMFGGTATARPAVEPQRSSTSGFGVRAPTL